MPNRIIKDSILDSETVGPLPDFEWRLFVSLICLADDYGRYTANPSTIKGHAFNQRDGKVTAEDVAKGLERLREAGAIQIYAVAEKHYLCLPTWAKHQNIRAKQSKYPAPEEGEPASICKHLRADANICKQMLADENICKQMQANAPVIQSNPIQSNPIQAGIKKATPPTLEDVKTECREKGYATDPEKFWNYYQSQGWRQSRGEPIKDWKALLAFWNTKDKGKEKPRINDPDRWNDPEMREWYAKAWGEKGKEQA